MVDNHVQVKVGDLEKNMKSRTVVKPKFTTDFPEAVVREGADELILRAEQEGMLHARHLSGHFPRGPGLRMGDHDLQSHGASESGQML